MAAVEQGRSLLARIRFAGLAERNDRLKGNCAHCHQHFGDVCAAFRTSQLAPQEGTPAWRNPLPDQPSVVGRRLRTNREGGGLGNRFDVMDDKVVVQGQADLHIMYGRAWLDSTAVSVIEGIGLAIVDPAFDIPQAVLTVITAKIILPAVQRLTRSWLGQRHVEGLRRGFRNGGTLGPTTGGSRDLSRRHSRCRRSACPADEDHSRSDPEPRRRDRGSRPFRRSGRCAPPAGDAPHWLASAAAPRKECREDAGYRGACSWHHATSWWLGPCLALPHAEQDPFR